MNCNRSDVEWLKQNELQGELHGSSISREWFPAFLERKESNEQVTYCSALAPVDNVEEILKESDWGCNPTDSVPCIWSVYHGENSEEEVVYRRFGNDQGVEPLVHERVFHGFKKKYFEVSEEFRLFYNLWAKQDGSCYLVYDNSGDESEAIRVTENSVLIRRDLLVRFCAVKVMAMIIEAVSCGTITPSERETMSRVVDGFVKAIQAHDIEKRIVRLEQEVRK